jgi:hypothetical protein
MELRMVETSFCVLNLIVRPWLIGRRNEHNELRRVHYYNAIPVLGLQNMALGLASGVVTNMEVSFFKDNSVMVVGVVRCAFYREINTSRRGEDIVSAKGQRP